MSFAGRENEQKILTAILQSKKPEFLAIYGRRRVGKTFLIREFFNHKPVLFLNTTGAKDASLHEQIEHFTKEISKTFYQSIPLQAGKSWDKTFELLTQAIHASKAKKSRSGCGYGAHHGEIRSRYQSARTIQKNR
jgi:uncharacterized protein